MSKLRVISASAGSGKTYRLVELVTEALLHPEAPVRPEGVVAVTYTRTAADELVGRLRTRLTEKGRSDLAMRLRDGRLGTLHSVCSSWIVRHAFELGLSPELAPLSDAAAASLARQALEEALQRPPEGFEAAAAQLSQDDWRDVVGQILARARVNGLDGPALLACVDRTLDVWKGELAGAAGPRTWKVLAELVAGALPDFEEAAGSSKRATQRVEKLAHFQRQLERQGTVPWSECLSLAKLLDTKAHRKVHPELFAALEVHAGSPDLLEDVTTFVRGAFELASTAYEVLQRRKEEARLLDFDDMLVHGLRLLQDPALSEPLAAEVDLVVVDEFQDVSPLQLAVVQELIARADQAAWVGDEKQAIYGFQGSAPELVRAAMEALPEGGAPEVLGHSYRSRPGLVRFYSDLFVAALARRGFAAERVRLEPARTDPHELAEEPTLERWIWRYDTRTTEDGNKERATEECAIADGVARLLAEAPQVVPKGEGVRTATAKDVAVLCRTNRQAGRLATALRARGLDAVVRLPGLLGTDEATLARAAIALVLDPDDGVAATTLAWLLDEIADPDAWLSERLEAMAAWRVRNDAARLAHKPPPRSPTVLAEVEPLQRLRSAHNALQGLAPADALRRCLELLALDRWALRGVDPALHLGNLDALVALAEAYQASCDAQRVPASLSGLLAAWADVASEGDDAQAATDDAHAVTVMTYHASKGLEWPIVVLGSLDDGARDTPFGLHVESPERIDASQPFRDRWLRLWPWPYGSHRTGVPLGDRAALCRSTTRVRDGEMRERARLLYVGFTRARDRLVLATGLRNGVSATTWLDELRTTDDAPALVWGEGVAVAGGVEHPCVEREVEPWPVPLAPRSEASRAWYPRAAPVDLPPARRRPSEALATAHAIGEVVDLGPSVVVPPGLDRRQLGEAIHRYLAWDTGEATLATRRARAAALLEPLGPSAAALASQVPSWADRLAEALTVRFPEAAWYVEWPLQGTDARGSLVRGEADMLAITALGVVVVDHKAYAGPDEGLDAVIAHYAGQLNSYATLACRAFGTTLHSTWLHLPLRGELVKVQLETTGTL